MKWSWLFTVLIYLYFQFNLNHLGRERESNSQNWKTLHSIRIHHSGPYDREIKNWNKLSFDTSIKQHHLLTARHKKWKIFFVNPFSDGTIQQAALRGKWGRLGPSVGKISCFPRSWIKPVDDLTFLKWKFWWLGNFKP